MTDATLDDVETDIERAAALESEDALDVLRTANRDLREIRDRPGVDDDYRRTLERRLGQRLREIRNREGYGEDLGTPDDDAH
jgi:hypothetical protein